MDKKVIDGVLYIVVCLVDGMLDFLFIKCIFIIDLLYLLFYILVCFVLNIDGFLKIL